MRIVDHYNCFAGEIYEHCKIYNAVLLGEDQWDHCANLIDFAATPNCGTVLDVGCGSGQFIGELLEANLVVRGIDPSDRQMSLAELSHGQDWNVVLLNSDMESFDNDRFLYDTIFFNETIGYAKYRQKEMVGKYYEMLNPGGSLIISTFLSMDTLNERGKREKDFERNQEVFKSLGADSQLRNIDFFEYMSFDLECIANTHRVFYKGEKQINQDWLQYRPSAGFMNIDVSEILKKHITVKIIKPR